MKYLYLKELQLSKFPVDALGHVVVCDKGLNFFCLFKYFSNPLNLLPQLAQHEVQ